MTKPEREVLRCAIYTRKSTEHNLDLEFNSLDAQREACEAYIKSQAQSRFNSAEIPSTFMVVLRCGALSPQQLWQLRLQVVIERFGRLRNSALRSVAIRRT